MAEAFTVTPEWITLSLYLRYQYLPAGQYGRILASLDGLYTVLAQYNARVVHGEFDPALPFGPPPLCIVESHTGESISTKFSFDRRLFPSAEFKPDSAELVIHLPQWSAALVVTGMVFAWGQDRVQTQAEIRNINLENEKLEMEVRQLADSIRADEKPGRIEHAVNMYVENLYFELGSPNIDEARVNGVRIK